VEMLIHDFNERFHDWKAMEFPSWLTQPLLVRFICSIRAMATGIMWVTARWTRENSCQDQRNDDVAVRGMQKKIPTL